MDTFVLVTGPITGTVTTASGQVVDVTPPALSFSTQAEVDEVAAAIGAAVQKEGV